MDNKMSKDKNTSIGRKKTGPPKDIKEKASMYFDQNLSLSEIATKFDTYPKKIERELKRGGYELRSRGDAQKIRLQTGKAEHPTEGKELSEATKIKISDGLHESWKNISAEEMDRRKQVSRDFMNNRPDKDLVVKMGQEAIKKSAIEGSILEKHVADQLNMKGYHVLIHQRHVIQDSKMHLDLLLENESIAIEIDGPAHHEELWAGSDIDKIKLRDSKKNSLLVLNGYNVIRVKQNQAMSDHFKRNITAKIIETIESIVSSPRPEKVHYI